MFSQDWVDKMEDATENFYITQDAFNQYWENRTIEKGKGWKQFKRWENFIAPRALRKDLPKGNLNLIPLIGKFSTALWVCGPHNASFGTFTSPRLSISTLKD
mgnify:CR=1 FL=1